MITGLIKKAKSLICRRPSKPTASSMPSRTKAPMVLTRQDHSISRKDISENTLKVLYRLKKHGYQAYLVGGGVRDLLLNKHPKDFDVATNALPEEIRKIFSNCRLIGRRFRLAHVHFGRDIIEVATFRKQVDHAHEEVAHSAAGMVLRDNVYGSIEEDAWRRDFTINALYYNIADFSVVDFTGGIQDLKDRKLRMIGDTATRFREDPVRMLRAIRFASKLDLSFSDELVAPMLASRSLITHVPPARLFEEVIKLFHSGAAYPAFEKLLEYGLFEALFPQTFACLQDNSYPTKALLIDVFTNTDKRIREDKGVTPVFIIAALLWYPILKLAQKYMDDGMSLYSARLKAMEICLSEQIKRISMPKRISFGAREIWMLQSRMQNRAGKRAERMMLEPRFRAAYDFLLVRSTAGEPIKELANWWQVYMEAEPSERRNLVRKASGKPKKKKRKKEDTEKK